MLDLDICVYVVDDDASVREALGRLVRSVGWRAKTFDSAQAFLAWPRPDEPSCLILDVRLPGLSGLELQRELARSNAGIPIIFLTGKGDIPTSVRAIKAGAAEFLTKPFDEKALLNAIRECVAGWHPARRRTESTSVSIPASVCIKEFAPFRLDSINQCLWRRTETGDDERILLAPKAFGVLRYLIERSGRLVTEAELLEAIWPNLCVQPEAVKSQLYAIRRVLGDNAKEPRFIETLPRRGYRFIAAVCEAAGDECTSLAGSDKRMVGRDLMLEELHECMRSASNGQRQLVFVTGEAGIGKTALVDHFQHEAVAGSTGLRVGRGQCLGTSGSTEPFYPVLDALGQLCRGRWAASIIKVLATDAPTWLVQFPWLLNSEHRRVLHQEILGITRERMLREIVGTLETIATDEPLLLVFEDLQWADQSTLGFLCALARRRTPTKLTLVATMRDVDLRVGDHSPRQLLQDLLVHRLCRTINLQPLSEADVVLYLTEESCPQALPDGLAPLLHRQSGGNPMFLRAVLDHVIELGRKSLEHGRWTFESAANEIRAAVPERVRAMVEARMAQLNADEYRALEAASAVGDIFTAGDAAKAASANTAEFEDLYDGLAHRRRVIRPATLGSNTGARGEYFYEFTAALFREALFQRQITTARSRPFRESLTLYAGG